MYNKSRLSDDSEYQAFACGVEDRFSFEPQKWFVLRKMNEISGQIISKSGRACMQVIRWEYYGVVSALRWCTVANGADVGIETALVVMVEYSWPEKFVFVWHSSCLPSLPVVLHEDRGMWEGAIWTGEMVFSIVCKAYSANIVQARWAIWDVNQSLMKCKPELDESKRRCF